MFPGLRSSYAVVQRCDRISCKVRIPFELQWIEDTQRLVAVVLINIIQKLMDRCNMSHLSIPSKSRFNDIA